MRLWYENIEYDIKLQIFEILSHWSQEVSSVSLQRCEGGCGEKMPEAPQLAPDSSPALAPEQDSVSLITELINSEMKDMKEMEDKAQGDIVLWI